ncbi:putative cyclin-D6-1 [Cocos nucifera]|uniref:Putative cyclin-D6-1 n=1 Tax=Cocos nucifera TaxID=13894 RepID=A0A8K0N9X2_COCNU|nr:putative cyclin-D6-1 [Cocos nucifera]
MEFVLENPLLFSDDEAQHPDSISSLFAAENNFLISHRGAIILSARRDAASVAQEFSPDLGPSVIYLAINYIDRFLSNREIPLVKPWIASLLSIACLSLAAKMTISGFSLADLQIPILMFFIVGKFLELKPSMIAASALLTAAFVLFPTHFPSFRSTVLSCKFVDKETLSAFCDAMLSAAMDGGSEQTVKEPGSSSDSPVTVLGSRDSENGRTVGSSLHDRDAKMTHLA